MIIRHLETRELRAVGIRGGIGEAFSRFLAKGEDKSPLAALALNRLPPGASWGTKRHANAEEFFFIVSGQAEVIDQGERHSLGMNDLLYAQRGQELAIRNEGTEELVFLAGLINSSKGLFG